ncbi:unnamed protein product [Oppiella nova]|uniref:Titin n=1 Tax=Oppiella nova TaxID=334625 RepID=A0A7R9M4H1_9ACAR|nr:unnamed protein product [Oppiella nova]CAG2170584.1 unnamed protein product [Oppiella nova]
MSTQRMKGSIHRYTANLTVEPKSTEFTLRLADTVCIDEDNDVEFNVQLSRSGVSVKWFKDGKPIRKSKSNVIESKETKHKLIIRNAKPNDSGEYTCVANGDQTRTQLQVNEDLAEFSLKLKDIFVKEGETATLSVEVAKPSHKVEWFCDDKKVVLTEKSILIEEGIHRKLVLNECTLFDKGIYSVVCKDKRSIAKLTVESAPRILTQKRQFTAKRDENFILEIQFDGYQPPKVEWFFADKALKTSKKLAIEALMSKTLLTIKKFDDSDVGNYRLRLKNNIGECSEEFSLSIIDRPEPPGRPQASEITNKSLVLSWPEPKNNGGSEVINYIIEFSDKKSEIWKIYNETFKVVDKNIKIEKLKQGMEYTFRVTAVNEVGNSDPSPISQNIVIRESKSGEKPVVIEELKPNVSSAPKTEVKLECKITGQPIPEVKWFRDSEELVVNKTMDITFEKQTATLIIKEVQPKSAGLYVCKASNPLGSARTQSTLKIEEKPSAIFDKKLSSMILRPGSNYRIDAEVKGYPSPQCIWTKDQKIRVKTIDNKTSLEIKTIQTEDSGVYSLKLTNELADVCYDFVLKVLDRPGSPDAPVRALNVEEDCVELSWKPPKDDGGSRVTHYLIEKCEKKTNLWKEVIKIDSKLLIQRVDRLVCGEEYLFRVCAINEFGKSNATLSQPIVCESPFDKPSAPLGPLLTSNNTEDSFTLSWNPPESDGNSPILEYIVEKKESDKKVWQKVGSVDGNKQSIDVINLKKETAYHFRITCRNKVGTSLPLAPEETITPKGRYGAPSMPGRPLQVTAMTNTSLTLSWDRPLSTGGVELTAYILERRLVSESNWIRVDTIDPDITSYTVENLSAKHEYFFRVIAENPLGRSPPLETETALKLSLTAAQPGIPTGPLETRVVGPSAIVVEWGKPETDGGAPILSYVVAARDVRRTMWMEVGHVSADTQRLQIKDLQEGHEYLVRIMARNEVGLSDPLVMEEPVRVVRPPGYTELAQEFEVERPDTPSLSFTTTETSSSWMREANVEPLVSSYTRHTLIQRREYFFKLWFHSDTLFK